MDEQVQERRTTSRLPTRSLVEVKLPSWEALRAVYTINMSLGGIRLSLGSRPPLGTRLDIIMTLPNGVRLHLPGTVANLGPGGAGDVGVRFDELSERVRAEIERYLDDLREGRVPSPPVGIPAGALIKKPT